ncbi:ferredoxin reductase [Saccharopolyspora hirsuta]|uniref:Ferredoxin reductase n=1 Tax=Saccharopolyspora hirsuta TaxID=1837 RepID=A0A5M7BBQ6_SACHI|nr:ferredoxin reductase [Saccharopolyspora hirsuta]
MNAIPARTWQQVVWRRTRRVLSSRIVNALAEPHGVDRYLGLINPLWSVDEVRALVVAVSRRTADTTTLTLRPNANWRGAEAGQHVRLSVEIDGVTRTRCFSLANSADRRDGTLEITAKVNPAGTVSRWLREHAKPGLVVGLSQAGGGFALPDRPGEHVLLISGGSGITPVMSIARTLLARGHPGRISFLHYARRPEDVVYRAELADMARAHPHFALALSFTRRPGRGQFDGRFDAVHVRALAPDYQNALTYACGPAPLLADVGAMWTGEGLAERLRIERFALAPAPSATAEQTAGELRFTRSGITAPADGRTLLEQAESAGLRPEHGCRMGICHTCSSVKSSGAVRDVRSGAVSTEPDERIQLCVMAPVGDVDIAI